MPGKRVKPDYVTKPQLDETIAAQDERMDVKLAAQDERIDVKLAAQDQRNAVVWNAMLDKIDQLSIDLGRHAKAIQESVAAQIKVIDEKYADLPGRVAALEARSTP